jgi:hypothetical protein
VHWLWTVPVCCDQSSDLKKSLQHQVCDLGSLSGRNIFLWALVRRAKLSRAKQGPRLVALVLQAGLLGVVASPREYRVLLDLGARPREAKRLIKDCDAHPQ